MAEAENEMDNGQPIAEGLEERAEVDMPEAQAQGPAQAPDEEEEDDEDEDEEDEEEESDEEDDEIYGDDGTQPWSPPLGPHDEGRMRLTEEEHEWAKEIKEAASKVPELDPLSDFMYAQLAIVTLVDRTDTNLAGVLDRIGQLQEYRKEHRIHDYTAAECRSLLERTFRYLIPGHWISFSYHLGEGSYVLALDLTKFNRDVMTDPDKHDMWLGAAYQVYQAYQPDFEAIRKGVILLFECQNYDWKSRDMFNVHCTRKIAELESIYPVRRRSVRFYNTGMFINLVLSVTRRLLPSHFTESIQVGHELEQGRLDQLFVVPDLETTNQRNIQRILDALRRRQLNETSFKLDDI